MLDKEEYSSEQTVESWVMEKCNHWRDHFTNNYEEKFDEYNRLHDHTDPSDDGQAGKGVEPDYLYQ